MINLQPIPANDKKRGKAPVDWPRRVLLAPDKFKGTLTSEQVGRAMAKGLRRQWPEVEFKRLVIADGGEGFAQALRAAVGGTVHSIKTTDALGRPCRASYVVFPDRRTAAFDLAAASGLAQIPLGRRNPANTSTFGSGLILRRMFRSGITRVWVGLGGSATNDGGIGMAAALGYRFLDTNGRDIPLTAAGLNRLQMIAVPTRREWPRITAAVDVDNPLYGRNGATYRFALQKGARRSALRNLDRNLRRLAEKAKRFLGKDHAARPGAGAAGGCGFGLLTFFGASLEPGFEILRKKLGLDRMVRESDLVVTGEGCLDVTSLAGKAPYRLAILAKKKRRPVWALFGRIKLRKAHAYFDRTGALVKNDLKVKNAMKLPAGFHSRRIVAMAAAMAKSGRA